MAKRTKNSQNPSPADGVVRVVTDETQTIQSPMPPEALGVLSLTPLDGDGALELVSMPNDDTTINMATMDDAFTEPPEPLTRPSENLPALQAIETTGISSNTPPLGDVFNPRVWQLEADLQAAYAKLHAVEAELVRAQTDRFHAIAEAGQVTQQHLDDLRNSKLWQVQVRRAGVAINTLVLAHDALAAIRKSVAANDVAVEDVTSVKPIADRVIL